MSELSPQDQLKAAAAETAAAQLHDGMIVGLGTGSTAAFAIDAIGKRVAQGLKIIGVPTSQRTTQQATALGIPLAPVEEHEWIDVTIDGADEVELGTLNLIKGRGGALLREKIVASSTRKLIIVVDESKIVTRLGSHDPIPVEVVSFGWQTTERRLQRIGGNPILRYKSDGSVFLTDGGHYILDCKFGPLPESLDTERKLNDTVGVVEHGMFLGMTGMVIVGGVNGIQILQRP
jgi:ribose 5-phosphate isomerase A